MHAIIVLLSSSPDRKAPTSNIAGQASVHGVIDRSTQFLQRRRRAVGDVEQIPVAVFPPAPKLFNFPSEGRELFKQFSCPVSGPYQ